MQDSLDAWFKREILTHEDVLMRFLTRVWPRRDEREDIRYDAYARVYEAAIKSRPLAPKSFLFATVRNLMADRIRRERIVSISAGGENEYLNVLVDEISPEQRASATQELVRVARAFDRLTPKCREVIWLRRVLELSQKQAAAKLGVTEKAIEKRLAVAVRLIVQYMRTNTLTGHDRRGRQPESDLNDHDDDAEVGRT
jgi:RNA polymerase sigma-70 factor (ECF subfamily)